MPPTYENLLGLTLVTRPNITGKDGVFAHLFHYVSDEGICRSISESHRLIPGSEDELIVMAEAEYFGYGKNRVNLTNVLPEQGIEYIRAATGLISGQPIHYGLELLIPIDDLHQRFEHLPRAWQIFTNEPVEVRVLRRWHLDRLQSRIKHGAIVHRFKTPDGFPRAHYDSGKECRFNAPTSTQFKSGCLSLQI